jgi:hypothetical protein
MSTFEPAVVTSILKNSTLVLEREKKGFEGKWKMSVSCFQPISGTTLMYNNTKVDSRLNAWLKSRGTGTRTQSSSVPQLEWEANIVEYVAFVYKHTKHQRNTKKDGPAPSLPKDIPFLGPRFLPPSYLHSQKRYPTPVSQPQTAYLKPLNIIHPFYYDHLNKCPQCNSLDVHWDGWTTSGHRDLHGLCEEETALGYQLICKQCKDKYSGAKEDASGNHGGFCFATTNPLFWKNWEHWAIPR